MSGSIAVEPAGVALLNPRADGGRAAGLRRPIEAWLARHAPGVSLLVPGHVEAAQAMLTILAPCTRVVLIGGDGSLNRLLPALLQGGHRVGLVSAGSGNDVARALGVAGLAWPEALAYALHAPVAPVDLGRFDSDQEVGCFVSSLSMGFDAAVAARAQQLPALLRGRQRYLWATLRELGQARPRELRVWADGRAIHEGPALLAALLNTPTYGCGIPAAPDARMDDHWFDLLLGGNIGRLRALRLFPALLRGRHRRAPGVTMQGLRHLRLEAETPWPLAVDGEVMAPTRRLTVQMLPKALYLAGAHMFARQSGPTRVENL